MQPGDTRGPACPDLSISDGGGLGTARKMCVVLQHHLAKGGAQTPPPVGYPRLKWRFPASSRSAPWQRLAVASPVRGASVLPRHPHDPPALKLRRTGQGRCRSPLDPIGRGGDCALPLHPHLSAIARSATADRPAFAKASLRQANPARVGCAPTSSRLDGDRGDVSSPRTPSTGSPRPDTGLSHADVGYAHAALRSKALERTMPPRSQRSIRLSQDLPWGRPVAGYNDARGIPARDERREKTLGIARPVNRLFHESAHEVVELCSRIGHVER